MARRSRADGTDEDEVTDTEEVDAEPVDPSTNQPLSDFMPFMQEGHEDAIATQQAAISASSSLGRVHAARDLVAAREELAVRAQMAQENLAAAREANKLPEQEFVLMPPDLYRARMQAMVLAEANALGTSTIRPGGQFKVGDQWVNANGEPIEVDDA